MSYVKNIYDRITQTIGLNDSFTPLHEPCLAGREWEYVKDCLDTGWVSSVGSYTRKFEEDLAKYTGHKRAIITVSGTAALHVALRLGGVEAQDEVLIPSLSFVATANAVTYCCATPHFCDSEESTLGINAEKLDKYLSEIAEIRNNSLFNKLSGARIRALVPMHVFGHPSNMSGLKKVCEKYHLVMIEDAAESIGSRIGHRHTGHDGLLSALSFNGNKTITTGGGGAILTNDHALADRAKHLTTTAKVPHKWDFFHDEIGYNYRMPNINAAVGCAQLERLEILIQNKRRLANRYIEAFKDMQGVRFFQEPEGTRSNYWLCALILDRENSAQLEPLLEMTNSHNIMTRPIWTPLHNLPAFKHAPKMNMAAVESLSSRIINIPSSATLGEE